MSEAEQPQQMPRRRVLQNVIFTLIARAQGALFTYIIIRMLLKALTIEQYGLHTLLFIGAMMNMSMLVQFGLHVTASRFLPEYFADSRFPLIARLFKYISFYQIGAGLVLGTVAVAIAPQIAGWINYPEYADLIRIFTVAAFAHIFSNLFEVLFGAIFRQQVVLYVSITYNTVRLIGLLLAIQLYGTFHAIVITETTAVCIMALLYWWFYLRVKREWPRVDDRPSPHTRARFRRFALWSYASNIGATVLTSATDMILISSMLGGVATGFYGLATRINSLAQRFLPDRLLHPVLQPLFFSEYANSREGAQFGFALMVKTTLLQSMAVGLWMTVMAEQMIVQFFDPRYAAAAGVVAVMSLFIPVIAVRKPLGFVIQNAERVEFFLYDKVAAILKIVLGVLLIPVWGMQAMVWLFGLTILLQISIQYFLIARYIRIRLDEWNVLKLIVNGAVAAGLFSLIRPYFTGMWGTLLSLVPWLIIFAGVNFVNKTFRSDERDFINKHLKYRVWIF